MAARIQKPLCWIITVIAIVAGFFSLAASLFILGLGVYKFVSGGSGSMSASELAWEVVAPAWPLYLATLALLGGGWVAFRRLNLFSPVPADQSRPPEV